MLNIIMNHPKVTAMSPRSAAAAILSLGLFIPGSVRGQVPDSLVQASDSLRQAPDSLRQAPDSLRQAPDSSGSTTVSVAESGDNPFADFETHFLANGLKVWFKSMPDAPNVSVSVAVPFGSHSDPRGKEGLAHFTEHMLFSDHEDRSEQEVKDAI